MARIYKDNNEFIYRDTVYLIDEQLKSLGISSNRKVATLEQLIALLHDESKAGTAQLLLERYTEETFKTQDEWQAWFSKNRERIFFSDVGGYKFRVVPEDYLKYVSGVKDVSSDK